MKPLTRVFHRLVGPSLVMSFDVDTLRLRLGDRTLAISRAEASELVEAHKKQDIYVPIRFLRSRRE